MFDSEICYKGLLGLLCRMVRQVRQVLLLVLYSALREGQED